MKKVIASLLVLLIISQSLVDLGILAYYAINKNYIAQKLCVNRNNPRLHCEGHCYLSKQLKKAEEGEQKQTANISKEKDELACIRIIELAQPVMIYHVIAEPLTASPAPYLTGAIRSLIKPPSA